MSAGTDARQPAKPTSAAAETRRRKRQADGAARRGARPAERGTGRGGRDAAEPAAEPVAVAQTTDESAQGEQPAKEEQQ